MEWEKFLCLDITKQKEMTINPSGQTEQWDKTEKEIEPFRASQTLSIKDKRKGDEKRKGFKKPEQKLGTRYIQRTVSNLVWLECRAKEKPGRRGHTTKQTLHYGGIYTMLSNWFLSRRHKLFSLIFLHHWVSALVYVMLDTEVGTKWSIQRFYVQAEFNTVLSNLEVVIQFIQSFFKNSCFANSYLLITVLVDK